MSRIKALCPNLLLLFTSLVVSGQVYAAPRYTVLQILPPAGYSEVDVNAVNDSGVVVGSLKTVRHHYRSVLHGNPIKSCAFIFQNGRFKVITPGSYQDNEAISINDSELIVGDSISTNNDTNSSRGYPWVYNDAQTHVLPASAQNASVVGVTNSGTILGSTFSNFLPDGSSDDPNTCVWKKGKLKVLSSGEPEGIDDAGNVYVQMLHPMYHTDRDCRVFRYDLSGHRTLLYLGECWSVSHKNGWIYGIRYDGNPSDPNFPTNYEEIIYHHGVITKPTISVSGINSQGDTVGFMPVGGGDKSYAVLRVNGRTYNLNDCTAGLPKGARLTEAKSINDNGWITADYTYPSATSDFVGILVLKPGKK